MKEIILVLDNSDQEINIVEDSSFKAIYLGTGSSELATNLKFVHSLPNIKSRIQIKAVVRDKSRFNMSAVLKILKGAKGTDSYLKIDCLILSELAYARAVPSLEINESDVKGGHGATIGHIDYDTIHYLMSKGLSLKESEDIIVEGFLKN